MRSRHWLSALSTIVLLAGASPAIARVGWAGAQRETLDKVLVTWSGKGAVDVYLADRADADPASARLVSQNDRDGHQEVAVGAAERPYFLLRDRADGSVVEVAERLVPLEHGSNFRDIGGYPAAGGKHVRWGLIYRSGATPLLTPEDQARIQTLGLHNMLDLRSDEERVIAPTKIDGVRYTAIGYSMMTIMKRVAATGNGADLYRGLPEMLAPQLRILFGMLEHKQAPVVYNCSAGQDRTGFATAMILSALGVPRDVIMKDYLLSTALRQPQYEMPPIDPARFPDNPVAQFFAKYHAAGDSAKAQPLVGPDGTPLLASAFVEIDRKWGSVDAYLDQELGVTPADVAMLRATYLE
jgi:protein-tyrosine phosphatase